MKHLKSKAKTFLRRHWKPEEAGKATATELTPSSTKAPPSALIVGPADTEAAIQGTEQSLALSASPVTEIDDVVISPTSNDDPWSLGYQEIQEREPALMADYEKHLSSLKSTAGNITLASKESVDSILKRLLDEREEKQWRVALFDKDIKIREQAEKLVKFLIWSDPFVKSALSTQPYAALAWSGVSLLLPLITSGTAQVKALLKGFDSISNAQMYWQLCEKTFLQHPEHQDHYQTLLQPLAEVYSHIIEYQARAICHLSKAQLSRAWQNVNGYDWAEKASDVAAQSESCANLLPLGQMEEIRKQHDKALLEMQQSQAILSEIRQILGQTQKIFEDQNEAKLLEALASDYRGYKDFNAQRVLGTCEWFFADARFRKWRDSHSSSLLWVSAGPGCGKSVLSRALVDECLLSTSITTSTTCYFFFKDGDDCRMHSQDALCAILHQLFTQDLTGSLIRKALPNHKNYGEKLPQTFSELWQILLACATSPDSGEIVCILDALDECENNSRGFLMEALQQFYSKHDKTARLKFLITSRPYDNLEASFQKFSDVAEYLRFDGDDKSEEISREINLVINKKVAEITPGFSSQDRHKICDRLKAMENRTYLWLYLTFDIIRESPCEYGRPADVEGLLSKLPSQVSEAYEKILDRSKDKRQTRILLQIVLAARRPLNLDEANIALASALQEEIFASPEALESQLWPQKNFKTVVKNLCGLFVSIYNSNLSFLHLTARDFLLNSERQGEWEGRLTMPGSHSTMSQACLHYLLLPKFATAIRDSPNRKLLFLRYAARSWHWHYRLQEEDAAKQSRKDARLLCRAKGGQAQGWILPYNIGLEHMSDLHLASYLNLKLVVEDVLNEEETDINEKDKKFGTALYIASSRGHSDIAQMLLAKGAEVNDKGGPMGTALHVASSKGYSDIVQILLDNGADVDARSGYFGTALQVASFNNRSDIVRMLLENGAEVNAKGRLYGTALRAASSKGYSDIVQILLENGAQVNAKGGLFGTALQGASSKGHDDIVQMLKRNMRENQYETM